MVNRRLCNTFGSIFFLTLSAFITIIDTLNANKSVKCQCSFNHHVSTQPLFLITSTPCCVATVCHQVRCMYCGNLGHFHRAISHLKWYKIVWIRYLACTFSQMNPVKMFSMFFAIWSSQIFPLEIYCSLNREPHCFLVYVCQCWPQTLASICRNMGIWDIFMLRPPGNIYIWCLGHWVDLFRPLLVVWSWI